jgi:aryl-alcohol dehydrogenase-like predicted oxidoreductase
METRRLGRTGHMSSVAIFGAAALSDVSQDQADQSIQAALSAGVNHIDVAPSYGEAELRLGPWIPKIRDRVFLGCKTEQRTKDGAWAELRRSLGRLQTDSLDLYQFHAVTSMDELDLVTQPGGALEAAIEAKKMGLTRFIGITGHGIHAPEVFLEALRRFDFDTVLFPINFVQYGNPVFRKNAEELVKTCRLKDVGTMIIKAICRGPWGENAHRFSTWYEPFTEMEDIQPAVNFALSQDITGLCTSGDVTILPKFLEACQNFKRMTREEQDEMILRAGQFEPLFR